MFFEVVHEVVERLDVGVHALLLRIGDKDDAVDSAQNEFAAGVVEYLAGNGIKMDSRFKAAHRSQIQRQKIEKQSSLGFGGERNHLALLLFRGLLVDDLQIRGFTAQPGAVIHDFAIDLAGCEVDETQDFPQSRGAAHSLRAKNIPVCATRLYIARTGLGAGYSGGSMARGNAESLKGKGLLGLRKGSSEKNGAESLAFRPAKCSS